MAKNVMFKDVPIPKHQKSAFDLSNEVKTSCRIGHLIPIYWAESVPGDSWSIKSEALCKLAPMLAPVLHRMDLYIHYFKVPMRLLMNEAMESGGTAIAGWKQFITGDPEAYYSAAQEALPYVTINNANKGYFAESTLADYLGLPVIDAGTTVTQDVDINVLPFFAYHKIYDDYFRDENLEDPVTETTLRDTSGGISLTGGDKNADIADICGTDPRFRSYEKDYLRGGLNTAYFGASADVELDLDVIGDGDATIYWTKHTGAALAAGGIIRDTTGTYYLADSADDPLRFRSGYDIGATATLEVMEWRRTLAITRFLEAEKRGGHRYNEMLLGVWGVLGDNAELDYPEYIGGTKVPIQISSILNQSQVLDPTAGVNDGAGGVPVTVDPQSLETGKGVGAGSTRRIKTYCKEHCIIMGILSVLPRTAYGGAMIERFWRKADRTDFFVPQIQNIGDQAVLQSEVGYDATGTDMDTEFSYQPRWSEYKFKNSTVHGAFLSTLDFWHMATIGDTSGPGPSFTNAWTRCLPSLDSNTRIFADQTVEDDLYIQVYNDVRAIRPIQLFDIPR